MTIRRAVRSMNRQLRTAAQLRQRESKLFAELCTKHGYLFADALPSKDRTSTVSVVGDGEKLTVELAYAVKLLVPASSSLGQHIAAGRKERDPRTSKSARARAKARAK